MFFVNFVKLFRFLELSFFFLFFFWRGGLVCFEMVKRVKNKIKWLKCTTIYWMNFFLEPVLFQFLFHCAMILFSFLFLLVVKHHNHHRQPNRAKQNHHRQTQKSKNNKKQIVAHLTIVIIFLIWYFCVIWIVNSQDLNVNGVVTLEVNFFFCIRLFVSPLKCKTFWVYLVFWFC